MKIYLHVIRAFLVTSNFKKRTNVFAVCKHNYITLVPNSHVALYCMCNTKTVVLKCN